MGSWLLSALQHKHSILHIFLNLQVEIYLTRYKHWFQDPNVTLHPRNRETLVIAQFRNAYDWLEAMRDRPHHAPIQHDTVPGAFPIQPNQLLCQGTASSGSIREQSHVKASANI